MDVFHEDEDSEESTTPVAKPLPHCNALQGVDRPAFHAHRAEEVFHEREDSQESKPPVAKPLPHCNALQGVDNLHAREGSISMEPSHLGK